LSGIRWLPNQRTRPPEPPFMQWCCWLSTIPSESRETLMQARQPRREAQPDNPSKSRRPERRSEALANGRRLQIHQEYTTNGRVRPGVIPRKGHGRVEQKSIRRLHLLSPLCILFSPGQEVANFSFPHASHWRQKVRSTFLQPSQWVGGARGRRTTV